MLYSLTKLFWSILKLRINVTTVFVLLSLYTYIYVYIIKVYFKTLKLSLEINFYYQKARKVGSVFDKLDL